MVGCEGLALKEESIISRNRLTIKDWPDRDRPRERLFRLGPGALSDAEILAILLGTGNLRETALELARRILSLSEERHGTSLGFLHEAPADELLDIAGMGPAKVARLMAAAEISRRLARENDTSERPAVVRQSSDVFRLVRGDLEGLDREVFMVLTLNARNQVTAREVVSMGSLDASIAHPREIFKSSVKKSAAAIVLVHNHPSGDPNPSQEDLDVTRRLIDAGRIMGIYVLDHVVVARGSYVSIRELCPGWFL